MRACARVVRERERESIHFRNKEKIKKEEEYT